MATLTLLMQVALACVFLVSGVAKLLDGDGTRQAAAGFGIPQRLVGPVTIALAPAELLTALLLVVEPVALPGLVAALLMLVAFTAAVLLALRAGRQVECHCFGRIGGADISLRTVVRNAVLATFAVVALFGLGADDPQVVAAVIGGATVAAAVIGAEGWAGKLARDRRDRADEAAFEQAMDGTATPENAPAFDLPILSGSRESLASLTGRGLPSLVTFMVPGCGPCKAMRPAVARWADAYRDRLQVVAISRGDAEDNQAAYEEWPHLTVLLDEGGEVSKEFGVHGTPAAALVGIDGRLIGGIASGERLVRRLLSAGLAGEEPELHAPPAPEEGAPADSIGLDSVVQLRPTVTRHGSDEAPVLVDEVTAAGATLDQIGGIVVTALDGQSPLADIVADLAEAFGTPPEVVGPDVLAMVRSLGRAGLLAGVAAEPASDEVDPVAEPARTG